MKINILIVLLCKSYYALSWVCNYPCNNIVRCRINNNCIPGPGNTSFLYKEDNELQVRWLEKFEYCRAKGDSSIYPDAGKGKCEYSRDICVWNSNNNSCDLNPNRNNDLFSECKDLLFNNKLI